MVGPRSDGDFAMSIGMGGGRIRKGASVVKKDRRKKQRKTAKPEGSMKAKKKATRTKAQMERLKNKLKQNKRDLFSYKYSSGVPSSDNRTRAMIENKGGLLDDITEFKKKLDKHELGEKNVLRAYKELRHYKKVIMRKPEKGVNKKRIQHEFMDKSGRVTKRLSDPKDPMVRKLVRKRKKLIKEKFQKQIKKYEESK